jgi:UDP-N-acetylmuramate-alanine ligase
MRLHFIAIGGSVMHSLALQLAQQGHHVSGSDDAIHEPSRSRLAAAGLLPEAEGWFAERITSDIELIVVGRHARTDNPELARARELGLRVVSFPEFVAERSQHQQRIVIAGSHGKTSITAMILHVLRGLGLEADYLIGAQVAGLDNPVRLSGTAPVIVIEGDEYPTAPDDPRPKFLHYRPHILVISGIAWDHINVFPTEQLYVGAFRELIANLDKAGMVVYNTEDERVKELVWKHTDEERHYRYPYETLPSLRSKDGSLEIKVDGKRGNVLVFGQHNLSNLAAAWQVCRLMAIEPEEFLAQISSFRGAARRLEIVHQSERLTVIRDFAHAPSKVRASVAAVAQHYRDANVIGVLELHTFSSLDPTYLPQYRGSLRGLEHRLVLVDAEALAIKHKQPIGHQQLRAAFRDRRMVTAGTQDEVKAFIRESLKPKGRNVILLMSSGALAGITPDEVVALAQAGT